MARGIRVSSVFINFILMCFLLSMASSVPADRYMPASWTEMCQAEVSPLKAPDMTSHHHEMNKLPFHFGFGKDRRNPFLKSSQELRNALLPTTDKADNTRTTTPSNRVGLPDKGVPFLSSTMVTSKTKMNNITCKISKSDAGHWKLMDLHDWQTDNGVNALTTPSNRTVVFSITVECETGANISLPWPMKSKGLREVRVRNCGLVDQFILANNPLVSLIPDELRVLDIRDSLWLVDLNSKNNILDNSKLDFINIDSDYDCGQDKSLEIYISRNVTLTSFDTFSSIGMNSPEDDNVGNVTSSGILSQGRTTKRPIRPEDRLITDKEASISDRLGMQMENLPNFPNFEDLFSDDNVTDSKIVNNASLTAKQDFFELLKKVKNTRIQCDFVKLLVRDESLSSDTPRHLLQVSTQEATHPVLRVLNYSSIGMLEFPRELSQWRLYFPRLMYLDLSHNHISEVKVEDYPVMPDSPRTIVNIRYNNVSKLTPDVLKSWASVEKFHVDMLHNPISCDCDMKPLILFFNDDLTFTGNMKQYEYVKHMHCTSPAYLKGKKLIYLNVDDLPCPTFESSYTSIIVLASLLGMFIILTIVLIRFKVEIRILLYTRLHVRLPCDSDAQRNNKLYDAFVSYSNEDSDWVLHNLVNYLEKDAYYGSTHGGVQNGVKKNSNPTTWNGSASRAMETKADHRAFKLCLHQRDFIPGKTIVDNIVDSIEASRHTIIVLSPSFMRSHWAMEELRQAYRQSLIEKTRHLIVVLLERVSDEDMDPLIRRCVKTFTYLQVQDSIFRDKLVFSLSTKDRATRRRDRTASKQTTAPNFLSNGSKTLDVTSAHDNLTYIYEQPIPSPVTSYNPRASNESVQIPSPVAYPSSPQQQNNFKFNGINNNNEISLQPDYYSFPSKNESVHSANMSDHGYYTLEIPRYCSPSTGSDNYVNSIDLKADHHHDGFRPDGPSRVLSNSSTSSTTALTWNL